MYLSVTPPLDIGLAPLLSSPSSSSSDSLSLGSSGSLGISPLSSLALRNFSRSACSFFRASASSLACSSVSQESANYDHSRNLFSGLFFCKLILFLLLFDFLQFLVIFVDPLLLLILCFPVNVQLVGERVDERLKVVFRLLRKSCHDHGSTKSETFGPLKHCVLRCKNPKIVFRNSISLSC